jgi:DNA-binding beta-propeller fold protein YncE
MTPPPPEVEVKREFEAPRAGARFVYVANPGRDTVAVIDSSSLSIKTVGVGDTPTYLSTVPGRDIALVINVGTKDLSLLRTDAAGATRVKDLHVVAGANAIAVAPDGKHAIAWYDSAQRTPGVGSFQDLSVLTLDDGAEASAPLTVGFKPTDVVFASDGSAAFVVNEDGISVLRFAEVKGPARAPIVRLSGGAPGMNDPRDVSVTKDGRYAVARRQNTAEVLLVDIAASKVTSVNLGGFVTDLDLHAPGGAGEKPYALAVLRNEATIVRLPVPEGFADSAQAVRTRLAGETIGSAALSPDGKTAVLYTTADPVERLVVVDLEGAEAPRPVRLRKAVRAVALAPDGVTALVVHTKVAGDPKATMDVEVMIDRSFGYTVVNLKDGFAKLQLTDVEVGPLAVTPDGTRAFVLLSREPDVRVAQRITLGSFLVDDFVLGSPPVAIAALAKEAGKVFVSQAHPQGRISFINWTSGEVQSVTGFELNGRISQ